jgi:hypothetical protein
MPKGGTLPPMGPEKQIVVYKPLQLSLDDKFFKTLISDWWDLASSLSLSG